MNDQLNFAARAAVAIILGSQLLACGESAPPASTSAAPGAASAPTAAPELKSLQAEITKLKAEVTRLQAENADLKQTPAALLLEVQKNAEALDPGKTAAALQALVNRFPSSPEAQTGGKLATALTAKIKAAADEKDRLARLGLKAIKVSASAELGGVSIKVNGFDLVKKWIFDDYGHQHFYREATRGNLYAVASVSISSKAKDPLLPGIGVYQAVGPNLVLLSPMAYEFQRWMDYGSYLGNGHDFRNDFSHTETIGFKAGAEVSEDYRSDVLFLVASKHACHKRETERFKNPPVFYTAGNCGMIKTTLTVDDFSQGNVVALRVLNVGKL